MANLILALFCFLPLLALVEPQQTLVKDPTYIVVAPRKVRPDQLIRVTATMLQMNYPTVTIRASIRKYGEEMAFATQTFTRPGLLNLEMKMPENVPVANYTLRVGGYSDGERSGLIFQNDTQLIFDHRKFSVFIQTSKPMYRQGQKVRMRIIPVQVNLKSMQATMDVYIKDASGAIVRHFISQQTNAGGVLPLDYQLAPNILNYGWWNISVVVDGSVYNKTFKVEEFYAPIFYVNVSMPTYMMEDSYGISGLVASNHTTGRGAKGNATVVLEIRPQGSTTPGRRLTQEIHFFDSRADFLFTTHDMRLASSQYLGNSELTVTAYVHDWLFNKTASGFQKAIVYLSKIRLEFLGGRVWTFKPSLPFTVRIAASYQDGSPLEPTHENRTIILKVTEERANAGGGDRQTMTSTYPLTVPEDSIAVHTMVPAASARRITMEANFEGDTEFKIDLVATNYSSPNGYYIQLTTPTQKPSVNEYMIFNVKTNIYVDQIFYHIVAGGNIIVSASLPLYGRQKLFSVALSRDMVPSARIVAYFIAPDGQVLVDTINFHVNGSNMHSMSVKFNRGKDFSYRTAEITVRADPLSYVAFSAIEYMLYGLGARNGLTWEEVVEDLYTYDDHANTSVVHHWKKNNQIIGSVYPSTPTFAYDVNSTFHYAGLHIFTDATVSSVYEPTYCNRSIGFFPCMDGSCYHVRDRCSRNPACSLDFQHLMGCENSTNAVNEKAIVSDDPLWRVKHIGAYFTDGAFLWQDQFTKPDGRIDIKVNIPTFPSTWVVSAFAMSRENGLAILPEPARYDGVRPMYMTLQGAKLLQAGEQLGLRVSVFNFWHQDMDILITLLPSPDYKFVKVGEFGIVSSYSPELGDGMQQVLVNVYPGGSRQIYMPVVPQRAGHITVTLRATSVVGGDEKTHSMWVDWNGVRNYWYTPIQVDLTKVPRITLPDVDIPIEEDPYIPELRTNLYVPSSSESTATFIGDLVGLSFFPGTDFDLTAEKLMRLPYGSAEQTVFNFAANLLTFKYLRSVDSPTVRIEQSAIIHTLNTRIQELLTYYNRDGSFKGFRFSPTPSVWLTAFAGKVLYESVLDMGDVQNYYEMDQSLLTDIAIWLAQQQEESGRFVDQTAYYDRRMNTGLMVDYNGQRILANAALTATAMITLQQLPVQNREDSLIALVNLAMTRGWTYLASVSNSVEDEFELALVTYALGFADNHDAQRGAAYRRLMKKMRVDPGGYVYWSNTKMQIMAAQSDGDGRYSITYKKLSRSNAYAVSATSLALLCHFKHSALFKTLGNNITAQGQAFLQQQRNHPGAFASTQDTYYALEALIQLSKGNQDRKTTYGMTFEITPLTDDQTTGYARLDRASWFDQHQYPVETPWGKLLVEAQGFGQALFGLESSTAHEHPWQLRNYDSENRANFDIDKADPTFSLNHRIQGRGFNDSYMDYHVCSGWIGNEFDTTGMIVMEIGIPSGYVVENKTLQAYVKGVVAKNGTLRSAEFYGRKAVFYFDHFQRDKEECVDFTAMRWYPVANMTEQQLIRVFEYYEPANFIKALYTVGNLFKNNICLVCGSYQCPYCPYYGASAGVQASLTLLLVAFLCSFFCSGPWIGGGMSAPWRGG